MRSAADPVRRVGVRLIDWTKGYSFRIFKGILDHARAGHAMQLDFEQPNAREIEPTRIDRHWRGDGLLVFRFTAEEAKEWRSRGIAVVNLSTETPPRCQPFPRVTLDNRLTGIMAAEYFLRQQLPHFAVVVDDNRAYSLQRADGFVERLARDGKTARKIQIPTSRFPAATRAKRNHQAAMAALRKLPLPCGVFAKDDLCAVWMIHAAHQVGLRVPQDVAVLGVCDDVVFCHATSPAISSLHYPGRMVGRAAIELLGRMMDGEAVDPQTHILIPPKKLVVRESTGQVEHPDPVVTAALRWLQGRISRRAPGVDELCRALGVSREILRQKFNKSLGRSPKQVIDAMRADLIAEHLLRRTWTVDHMAQHFGFTSSDDLCRFFKRIKQCTIGEWRRERSSRSHGFGE
ncbi:MAG: DNA-binding transcriptional regulator [Verrucomicrobia bacterium]|nr:DNA-binding transcriptional regulator [Verrucomicrobiota bacterium]